MSLGDYNRICTGHRNRIVNRSRDLRLIIATQVGKDPRELWTLPGDYSETHLDTPEMREMILHKFNVFDAWMGKKGEC